MEGGWVTARGCGREGGGYSALVPESVLTGIIHRFLCLCVYVCMFCVYVCAFVRFDYVCTLVCMCVGRIDFVNTEKSASINSEVDSVQVRQIKLKSPIWGLIR